MPERFASHYLDELEPGEILLHAPGSEGAIFNDKPGTTESVALRISVADSVVTILREDDEKLVVRAANYDAHTGARLPGTLPVFSPPVEQLVLSRQGAWWSTAETTGMTVTSREGFLGFISRVASYAQQKQKQAKNDVKINWD